MPKAIRPRLGNWGPTPEWGSMLDSFHKWFELCPSTTVWRSRGGEGELDDPWVLNDTKVAVEDGFMPSLQVQPKVGTGPARKGVPYKDIAAGKHDAKIISGFNEIKAVLPPLGPKVPFELHSEFNVQNGAIAAQPYVGPPEDYAGFVKRVHMLASQVGVRKRLLFTSSATRGVWSSNEWHQWLDGCIDNIDVVAVDGYSQPKTGQPKEFEYIVEPVINVASEAGKKWSIMETGSQEKTGDPNYKPGWYERAGDFIETYLQTPGVPRFMFAVFNTSNDGPGGFHPTTTEASKQAFIELCNRPIWLKRGVS